MVKNRDMAEVNRTLFVIVFDFYWSFCLSQRKKNKGCKSRLTTLYKFTLC